MFGAVSPAKARWTGYPVRSRRSEGTPSFVVIPCFCDSSLLSGECRGLYAWLNVGVGAQCCGTRSEGIERDSHRPRVRFSIPELAASPVTQPRAPSSEALANRDRRRVVMSISVELLSQTTVYCLHYDFVKGELAHRSRPWSREPQRRSLASGEGDFEA